MGWYEMQCGLLCRNARYKLELIVCLIAKTMQRCERYYMRTNLKAEVLLSELFPLLCISISINQNQRWSQFVVPRPESITCPHSGRLPSFWLLSFNADVYLCWISSYKFRLVLPCPALYTGLHRTVKKYPGDPAKLSSSYIARAERKVPYSHRSLCDCLVLVDINLLSLRILDHDRSSVSVCFNRDCSRWD